MRQALPEDKDAVLLIHDNVYEGRDYLPYYYDFLLSRPNATSFVLLHENRVVSQIVYKQLHVHLQSDHIKQGIVLAFQTDGCLLLHESSAAA